MIWGINYGKVTIVPTPTEWVIGGLGAAGVIAGVGRGDAPMVVLGGAIAAAVIYRSYERAAEVREPEWMNSYFVTQGEASAASGDMGDIAEVKKRLGHGRRRR